MSPQPLVEDRAEKFAVRGGTERVIDPSASLRSTTGQELEILPADLLEAAINLLA
jgi:hypothetical protein